MEKAEELLESSITKFDEYGKCTDTSNSSGEIPCSDKIDNSEDNHNDKSTENNSNVLGSKQAKIETKENVTNNNSQEVWVETVTDSGKAYYYHVITRETTWNKPTGESVKIIQQGKAETVDNKSLQVSRMLFDNSNPMNIPNRNQMSPQNLSANQETINIKNGPSPQHQKHLMPAQSFPPQAGYPVNTLPGNFNGSPFSVPPPGYTGNQQQHQQPWGMPWNVQNKSNQSEQLQKNVVAKHGVIDSNIICRAAEWSEHRAPDGRPYYYHAGRTESVWEKPQAIRDLEAARIAAHSGPPVTAVGSSNMGGISKPLKNPNIGLTNIEQTELKNKKKDFENNAAKNDHNDKSNSQTKKPTISAADKSRPVSSTPIGGTPWCVVWTGDGRVFFYNPSTRSSVWERPTELLDRTDVDRAIAITPQKAQVIPDRGDLSSIVIKSESDTDQTKNHLESEIKLEHDIPTKRIKVTESKFDVTKEAAIEAEVRASKERALVPLEVRVKSFKEMLREKDVSAFSTWEKELHKIVFDPRYLLLTSRERKQIFEKYVKDRAEEERKEKRNKMRQKRENFRELLESSSLYSKSSYGDFAQKYGKDEKFKAIEKNKERESLFNEYILEIRKKERDEKIHQKEMVKKKFLEMLKEKGDITRHCRWTDVKKKIESESRYKAVESSYLREEYFNDYCHILKEERKKNKDKGIERDLEKRSKEKQKDSSDQYTNNETDASINAKSDEENDRKQKERDRDRQQRAVQSIKEREKEVQRSLANHLRDRDKEREHHKRDEAVRHFNALLADLVRNADLTWKEVKKQLKKDHRWELVEHLDRENRERIYDEHIQSLIRKKRDSFRDMLDEMSLELTCSWKDVKKNIKNDPRFLKYNNSEKCEREFRDYIKDKTSLAKTSLKELLQECKLISHKSFDSVKENSTHLREIEEILKNDKRYLMLNHLEQERYQIIISYLEDLHKKGPPPPPTATETLRRK